MADILVIDDEVNLAYSIQLALERNQHACRVAETVAAGFAECTRQPPDLALVDIQLPDGDGLELIQRLGDSGLDVPVVVITAHGTIQRAVSAMKRGAVDFIQKPLSMEEVCLSVERCLENRRIRNELDAYRLAQQRESETICIVGECTTVRRALSLAERIANAPREAGEPLLATLLLGETGTGKEIFARHIHRHGPRATRPFVHVNCTAIPENLFESELFGHERGTFTDAKQAKRGLLEIAHGGSMLLDEIGDIPTTIQAKLLVAIETGCFRRLGGTCERVVDVRVLAASNSDLEAKVERGEFRSDLYFRIKTFSIELPPLRERGDDLFILTDYFLERFCRKYHKPLPQLPDETRAAMRGYHWPGNVRELANVLRSAVLINESGVLTPPALGIERHVSPHSGAAQGGLRFDVSRGDCTLATIEKQALRAALETTGGNASQAARLLGLSRGGLRHRLEKHELQLHDFSTPQSADSADEDSRRGADGQGGRL